jgi:hypothetical protein
MALNSNPFVEGIDPTSTFGGYASVLLQLIREAKPSSTYGMILFDTTAPDVTGANAWRKRSIWVSLLNPAQPTVNVYRESAPGWVNVNDVISPNTITTAMIQNAAVTLAKLSTAGGTANQLIRVNAGGTAFEFVSLSSLVTTGSIPVGSLITTGIPAGQLRFAGTFGPGVANWYTSQTIINDLVNGAIPTDLLSPAPGATTRSKFLTGRIGDTFAGWRFLEPNVDILNDTLSGGKLQNGTVAPIKVESSGIPDGYLLSKVGGVPDWVAPTAVAGSVTQFVTDIPTTLTQNIPTYTNPVTLAHTLGAVPLSFRVSLYCQTNDGNYIVGEEIDAAALNQGNAGDWWVPFNFQVTNAAVIVGRFDNAHNILITNKTGANHSINLGRWRLRLYAMKVN